MAEFGFGCRTAGAKRRLKGSGRIAVVAKQMVWGEPAGCSNRHRGSPTRRLDRAGRPHQTRRRRHGTRLGREPKEVKPGWRVCWELSPARGVVGASLGSLKITCKRVAALVGASLRIFSVM